MVRNIALAVLLTGSVLLILTFLMAVTFAGSCKATHALCRIAIALLAVGLAGTVVGATLE